MSQRLRLIVVALAIVIAALYPRAATAGPIYTYTGNLFTDVDDISLIAGAYDTSMRLSGSVELLAALGPNLAFGAVAPTSFSFSDGRHVIDTSNASFASFEFATDALGNIIAWNVRVESLSLTGTSQVSMRTVRNAPGFGIFDEAVAELGAPEESAFNTDNPGQWTAVPQAVPEPASLTFLGIGLAGLGLKLRRRK